MKNSAEDNPICDVAVELPTVENGCDESARRKVQEGFSDWASSAKNANLASRAKTLWRYLNDKRTPAVNKAAIVAALLYCIVPVDMVPDFIPLAGLLDDLAIVLGVLAYVDAKAGADAGADAHPEAGTGAAGNDRDPGKNRGGTAL